MPPRRLLGIRSCPPAPVRWPAMSASDSTASRTDGQMKPLAIIPRATCTRSASGATAGSPTSSSRAPRFSPRSSSTSRCAGPWPSVTSTTRHRSVTHCRMSEITRRGIAPVCLRRTGIHLERFASRLVGGLKVGLGGRASPGALARRPFAPHGCSGVQRYRGTRDHRRASCGPARLPGRGGNKRRDGPPGQPGRPGRVPDLGDRPERRRAKVDRDLAAGGRVHPGRLEELLAGPDQLGGARPDPLRVAGDHARRPLARGRAAAPSGRRAPARTPPCLRP